MHRQNKEVRGRWDKETTGFVLDGLLRGKPVSPYGSHDGRLDLRGLTIEEPERVRVNENYNRITQIYEFKRVEIRDIDVSYATLPEWRVSESKFENCAFEGTKFPSLRTYSATFDSCKFRSSNLRGASLGAEAKGRKEGGLYLNCDFAGADLREIGTENARFSNCVFADARWFKTQTLSAVFESCDFRDAEIREVYFDGRRFDSHGLAGLGENKMMGCDFSTSRLEYTGFLAIDFRNLVPPRASRYVLVTDFPRRVKVALDRLKANGTRDAAGLAFVFDAEFFAAKVLPPDATGMLDFGGLSDADARLLAEVFEL